jgi:uncharacterized protein (TIGR03435 family)
MKHLAALLIGASAVSSAGLLARTPPQLPDVAFDVVSIRSSVKNGGNAIYVNFHASGLYIARNVTVDDLIKEAYGFGLRTIGGPDWTDTRRFDISAKSEISNAGMLRAAHVKSLLADRFMFAAHMETRELPVYFLVKAHADGRLGPLMRPAKGCDWKSPHQPPRAGSRTDPLPTCGMLFNSTRQSAGEAPLASLILNLPRASIDRPVFDRTGLTGYLDWDLQWENDQTGASTGVSIFSALQEQLGLKLQPGRGPVEVLVIDRVEMPALD